MGANSPWGETGNYLFDDHLKLQANLPVLNKIHPERDQVC